jgi:acetyl esterase/lipase
MKIRIQTRALLSALALSVIWTVPNGASAQTTASSVTRQSDVIYGRKLGMALTMEVFAPAASNGVGVVWLVSSSGRSSREQTLQTSFEQRIAPLLDRGYVVFAVIHGSAPLFNLQDQVGDARRALRFVRHHAAEFGIDGERLAISGSSAGGLLALIVAMQGQGGDPTSDDVVDQTSAQVQAAGAFFAPTDLLNFGAPSQNVVDLMQQSGGVDPSFEFFEIDVGTGVRRLITAQEDIVSMLQEYSPVTHVTPDDPPTILIHGDQDRAVPVQQSRQLLSRLREQSVPANMVVREGAGHAYVGWEDDAALIADWFDIYLREKQ